MNFTGQAEESGGLWKSSFTNRAESAPDFFFLNNL